MYTPPYKITSEIIRLIGEISEQVGSIMTRLGDNIPSPQLRKKNQIKTIHSSLAIEHNSFCDEVAESMKKLFFLLVSLSFVINMNAQSFLCTYEGGYFIKNDNVWYEYRPEETGDVYSLYKQYYDGEFYFYIMNSEYELRIPKSINDDIQIKKNDSYKKLHKPIKIYDFCPEHSSQLFISTEGFFIKRGNNWSLYIPSKKKNSMWNSYKQYKVDDNYYYINNSSDTIAIPRSPLESFYIMRNHEFLEWGSAVALYDHDSSFANSGKKLIVETTTTYLGESSDRKTSDKDISFFSSLPKSWRQEVPNGYMDCTMNEDGSLTSTTYFNCYICKKIGKCTVCMGYGKRYIYSWGIMDCGYCGGSGDCPSCGGKGYNVIQSKTEYGVTVSVDEFGNTHISGVGDRDLGGSSSSKNYVEKIEDIPCYGYDCIVYCSKCKAKLPRHIHVKVRR